MATVTGLSLTTVQYSSVTSSMVTRGKAESSYMMGSNSSTMDSSFLSHPPVMYPCRRISGADTEAVSVAKKINIAYYLPENTILKNEQNKDYSYIQINDNILNLFGQSS